MRLCGIRDFSIRSFNALGASFIASYQNKKGFRAWLSRLSKAANTMAQLVAQFFGLENERFLKSERGGAYPPSERQAKAVPGSPLLNQVT